MNDLLPLSEYNYEPAPERTRVPRWVVLVAYSLALVLVTATVTFTIRAPESSAPDSPTSAAPDSPPSGNDQSPTLPLAFGEQNIVVDTVTVPAGTSKPALLHFDATIDGSPTSKPRAAMVSFRVECHSRDDQVAMQADGKVSTNVFLARGGTLSGQALTEDATEELTCTLLASAPYIEAKDDGLSSLPLNANLSLETTDGVHLLALHRLDDATLFKKGTSRNVLSRQIEDPAALDRMSSTVRLTSCTVVGGSSDSGQNQCLESMTGKESSTVQIRVIARWLDAEGNIRSTSTYWDETLAVDYNTHHVPWTLRQKDMADQVPEEADAVVLVVQVEHIAGTPFVVHADGTDSVISTDA